MRGFSFVALSLAFLMNLAHAEDVKMATVDMQKALQTVDAGKQAKVQLESEFNAKKKELQTEEASLRKMTEDFKKQSAVMSDSARNKKQAEIQQRVGKYQEETQRSQMAIEQKQHELTDPILTKLRSLISTIAKQKGYTAVFEKNENILLYSLDKDDLTTDVIAAYNKGST